MNRFVFTPKKSISARICLIFAIIMFLCVGLIILFNTLFLEKIYINKRADVLRKSYTILNTSLMSAFEQGYTMSDMLGRDNAIIGPGASPYVNDSSLARFLSELQDRYNVSVVIIDADSNAYSLSKGPKRLDRQLNNYIFNGTEETGPGATVIEKTEKYTIVITNHFPSPSKNSNNANLDCWGFFDDNKTSFLLSTPIISIQEPIDIFNHALFFVSFIVIIIGIFCIIFSSNKITEPIIELAKISHKLSKFDFSEKYTGSREDEIGILGNSMNEMSQSLEKTINELKEANTHLQKDLDEKEKLDQMRQEFVANVSHELKTPIALIQGYAEGLSEGMAESPESRDYYCNVIMDEATKMNKIVRQLLNLSSIEKGNETLDIEEIKLKEVVESVVMSCKLLLDEKEINCNVNIEDDIIILADELKCEEVIRNYLTNAINHVDENKIIEIYTENSKNNLIRLCVYNSGSKLSNENLTMIWEKFYKVDKAHTRQYGGTGLGLPIVKAIANQHTTKCGCYNYEKSDDKPEGIVFYFDFKVTNI